MKSSINRLQQLHERREKLILLNNENQYSVTGHSKIQKYYDCMLNTKREIFSLEYYNFRPANAKVGLTVKDLYNLTKP